jgi:hypothetical protein
MCGSVSAIGLADQEREHWPYLRERLRVPGRFMALMRGVLGDAEVAAVVAVTAEGTVTPLAILALPEVIAEELHLDPAAPVKNGVRPAKIGDYDVEVVVGDAGDIPLAILATPWIDQHLLLYARTLWHPRYRPRSG